MKHLMGISALILWLALLANAPSVSSAAAESTIGAKLKYEEPIFLTGSIYAGDDDADKLLFRFKRVARRAGSKLEVQREFA